MGLLQEIFALKLLQAPRFKENGTQLPDVAQFDLSGARWICQGVMGVSPMVQLGVRAIL